MTVGVPRAARQGGARSVWAGLGGAMALVVGLAACSSASTDPPTAATAKLPCDVAAVLARRCHMCHGTVPASGVPFSLVTMDDLRRTTKLNRAGVEAPIWQSIGEALEDDRMPLSPSTGLPSPMAATEPDRALLLAWVRDGAPASTTSDCGPSATGAHAAATLAHDLEAR